MRSFTRAPRAHKQILVVVGIARRTFPPGLTDQHIDDLFTALTGHRLDDGDHANVLPAADTTANLPSEQGFVKVPARADSASRGPPGR